MALAISVIACEKKDETKQAKELKTAYVDTSVLMKEYQKTKDIEAKLNAKADS